MIPAKKREVIQKEAGLFCRTSSSVRDGSLKNLNDLNEAVVRGGVLREFHACFVLEVVSEEGSSAGLLASWCLELPDRVLS